VKLCPHGVFLPPRAGRYDDVSRTVFATLLETTPLVEPLSIDEAFLDVTGCVPPGGGSPRGGLTAAEAIGRDVQARVERATGGLTCSVGVAENKFLAKVASDLRKPRGLVVVPRGDGARFLAPLPVERLWGVGPKTAERLHSAGLRTVGDLAKLGEKSLTSIVGDDLGRHLRDLSLGIDGRPVVTEWESKSLSQETTFATFLPVQDREAIEAALFSLADGVAFRLRHEGFWGRTVHLKVRDERFRTITRSVTLPSPTQIVEDIYAAALQLYREKGRPSGKEIRLLGVRVTNLLREPLRQLDLFGVEAEQQARRRAAVADAILEKIGDGTITRGSLLSRGPPRPGDRGAKRRIGS
jgi:nucleotidyltransferase/DNA polymerase involved in DNA repair